MTQCWKSYHHWYDHCYMPKLLSWRCSCLYWSQFSKCQSHCLFMSFFPPCGLSTDSSLHKEITSLLTFFTFSVSFYSAFCSIVTSCRIQMRKTVIQHGDQQQNKDTYITFISSSWVFGLLQSIDFLQCVQCTCLWPFFFFIFIF